MTDEKIPEWKLRARLEQSTVKDLREKLEEMGAPVSGTKGELVKRLLGGWNPEIDHDADPDGSEADDTESDAGEPDAPAEAGGEETPEAPVEPVEVKHPLEDSGVHGRTLNGFADHGILYAEDVAELIDGSPHGEAAAHKLSKLKGVGKKGAAEVLAWTREVTGWIGPDDVFEPDIGPGDCSDCGGQLTDHPEDDPYCEACARLDGPDDNGFPSKLGAAKFAWRNNPTGSRFIREFGELTAEEKAEFKAWRDEQTDSKAITITGQADAEAVESELVSSKAAPSWTAPADLDDVEQPPFELECRYCGGDVDRVDPGDPYICTACFEGSREPVPAPRPELPPIVPDPNKNRKLPDAGISPTVQRIFENYEKSRDPSRRGRNISVGSLGLECERKIWYQWRWAWPRETDGQQVRLYQTGDLEEIRFARELRGVGVQLWTKQSEVSGPHTVGFFADQWHVFAPTGAAVESHGMDGQKAHERADKLNEKQIGVSTLDGHVRGKLDGVGKGFIEAPKTPHVVEFKTANEKGFKKVSKLGVEAAYPTHYAQMMIYMHELELTRAFYLITNKNTDELYSERVKYHEGKAAALYEKAKRIIKAEEPPDRISNSSTFWKCKFCDYADPCHRGYSPEVHCRTCVHSTPVLDGSGREYGAWVCEWGGGRHELGNERQAVGCNQHLYIPDLLSPLFEYVQADDPLQPRWIEYRDRHGEPVYNCVDTDPYGGELDGLIHELGTPAIFRSEELHASPISLETNYAELRDELGRIPF